MLRNRVPAAVLAASLAPAGCTVTFGGDDDVVPLGTPPPRVEVVVARRLELTGGVTVNRAYEDRRFGEPSCRGLELEPFDFDDFGERPDVDLTLLTSARRPRPPGDVTLEPDLVRGERRSEAGGSWRPRGPVRLRRTAGNTAGELVVAGWTYDGRSATALPPVSGRLTWTCTVVRR